MFYILAEKVLRVKLNSAIDIWYNVPTLVDTFRFTLEAVLVTVGIRELKQQASELVRQVRENGRPVQITYHGKVVAMLVPVEQAKSNEAEMSAWAALDELAVQIGRRWPESVSAQQALAEDRE